MPYVYILSSGHAYGAWGVHATTDRKALSAMLEAKFVAEGSPDDSRQEPRERLAASLGLSDSDLAAQTAADELAGISLCDIRGLRLHVVPLFQQDKPQPGVYRFLSSPFSGDIAKTGFSITMINGESMPLEQSDDMENWFPVNGTPEMRYVRAVTKAEGVSSLTSGS